MKIDPALLKSKGWGQDEIAKASNIIERAEKKKHKSIIVLDRSIYWIALATGIVSNLVAAAFLLPVVAFVPGTTLYIIVSIIGACFGSLFTVLVRDNERMRSGHHLLAMVLMPLSAVAVFLAMIPLAEANGLNHQGHSTIGISMAYVVFYLLPYAFFLVEERFDWFDLKKA